MHADIVRYLRCPVCADQLTDTGGALRCGRGHSFDVARQGYVNLLTGEPVGGDSAEMVAARAELLAAGHFDFLTEAVIEAAGLPSYQRGIVVEAGAGTGHHLAALLERRPDLVGLALDSAKAAAKRAARAHPRLVAAVCDVWRGLPLADACADLLLNIFAPRNGADFRRVLRPDGKLIVVTPRHDHLAELVKALGLIAVDPAKERRLSTSLGSHFQDIYIRQYVRQLALTRHEVRLLVGMGPSARHLGAEELAARVEALPEPVRVTAAIRLSTYVPR